MDSVTLRVCTRHTHPPNEEESPVFAGSMCSKRTIVNAHQLAELALGPGVCKIAGGYYGMISHATNRITHLGDSYSGQSSGVELGPLGRDAPKVSTSATHFLAC
jgi:hypothetical protein